MNKYLSKKLRKYGGNNIFTINNTILFIILSIIIYFSINNPSISRDESEDKFVLGTTTETGSSTGNLDITSDILVVSKVEDNVGNVTDNENNNITDINERIIKSNVIVIGAGYGKHEYERINKKFPNYIGIGGFINDNTNNGPIQIEELSHSIFKENNPEKVAKFILNIRNNKKFEKTYVDRSVINLFGHNVNSTVNWRPYDFNLNEETFAIKFWKLILENNANIYIFDEINFDNIKNKEEFENKLKTYSELKNIKVIDNY